MIIINSFLLFPGALGKNEEWNAEGMLTKFTMLCSLVVSCKCLWEFWSRVDFLLDDNCHSKLKPCLPEATRFVLLVICLPLLLTGSHSQEEVV